MGERYKYENDFLNSLDKFFIRKGFNVWREVSPDEMLNTKFAFRVDMIIHSDETGFIAIEGKNFNTIRSGGKISKAIDQINKYKRFTYLNGNKITKWCLTSPWNTCLDNVKHEIHIKDEIMTFIKYFIKTRYNISILDFNNGCEYLSIDSHTKDAINISIKDSQYKSTFIMNDDKRYCPHCKREFDYEDIIECSCNLCNGLINKEGCYGEKY